MELSERHTEFSEHGTELCESYTMSEHRTELSEHRTNLPECCVEHFQRRAERPGRLDGAAPSRVGPSPK